MFMSKAEKWETLVLFAALLIFWPRILGSEHIIWSLLMYVSIPVLVWIAVRRWRRFMSEVKRQQAERERRFGPRSPLGR